jgi:diguanylate cyclase (GGDEF)-like protein
MFQANEHGGPTVGATDQRPTPPATVAASQPGQETISTERKPLFGAFSVKTIAYASASLIIVLFLSITATNLLLSKTYYQGPEDEGLSLRLADKAQVLESQLAFFQQIVNHVATQPTTQDILENKDETAAQTWALQMQRFLPQAMGVALLTKSGQIMGLPADTQLGPQSLTDLAKLSQGEPISMPPVHRLTEATSHFDLVAPVLDETDAPLGMVFVSFGLKTLQPLLQNNTNNAQRLVLRDGRGNIVAQHNRLEDTDKTRQLKIKLADSDWQLSLTENIQHSLPSFLSLAIFNISALLLTVGIVAFLVRYALRTLGTDFAQIKTLLNGLAEGETLAEEFAMPQLLETAEILPAISHIQRGIEKKQQLLQHRQLSDELTGLPNRRQFNIEFARAYDFARRGTPVCVVRLHLDSLDALNDKQADQVVMLLSKTLKEHTRKIDHVARLDRDGFAVLMFGMSAEGTVPCLERMHKSFLGLQAQHPAIPDTLICSLHFGYTLIHPHRDNSAAEVLKRSEAALTEAQQSSERCIIAA